jgi:hypothetical protein
MTRDTDIERVLDRFYAEGPSEMPDRLFLGVFDRIERVPQRRLASRMTRFATMNSNFRLAAAAAIVVALVGIGAFAIGRPSNVASPPTPGPTQVATPTPAAGVPEPLPAALQGRWVGEPRVVPTLPEPPFRNALIVSDSQLGFAVTGAGSTSQKQLASVAALIAPDQVRLRGASSDGGCVPGNEGTYTFALSNQDTVLTLTPVSDVCGPRAAALAGDWTHVGCTDDQGWCLGDLAPGTYRSTVFTPFTDPGQWAYHYGELTYTAVAGWRNAEDYPGGMAFVQKGAPENTGIFIWSDAVAHSQADQCSEVPEPGVGRTADEIVAWLTTVPGLVTSVPEPIAIGGLSGKMIDLSVAPTWTTSCPYAYASGVPLVSTFTDSKEGPGLDWNIQREGRTRIVALDLGDGRALIINIEAQTKADYDALLPGAMQLVNSFTFNR